MASDFYSTISKQTRGAWVIHHAQKTASTIHGGAEFPALDTAGKAASLLSQIAASAQHQVSKAKVDALGRAAGLNPRTELPSLLDLLVQKRVIDRSLEGDVEVLGLSSSATVQHAAEIFDDQDPTKEEKAAVALAELTSSQPREIIRTSQFLGDEFNLSSRGTADFLDRSETVGFIDAEGAGTDKVYFNGNLFRRDNLAKVGRVLSSLTPAERSKVTSLDQQLDGAGCLSVKVVEQQLGLSLFEKLRAASMYDVNHVANAEGEHGFVTKPAAFHKFHDPMADDAFDLAKALVAALTYGMTQSAAGRGRIGMIESLLRNLINGQSVGPATAIGEDYKILETKGVLQLTKGPRYGYLMALKKIDIGQMALKVLTTGEASSVSTIDRLLPGSMTGYVGPEKSRVDFRQRQVPASKRLTFDVLQVLRTEGL